MDKDVRYRASESLWPSNKMHFTAELAHLPSDGVCYPSCDCVPCFKIPSCCAACLPRLVSSNFEWPSPWRRIITIFYKSTVFRVNKEARQVEECNPRRPSLGSRWRPGLWTGTDCSILCYSQCPKLYLSLISTSATNTGDCSCFRVYMQKGAQGLYGDGGHPLRAAGVCDCVCAKRHDTHESQRCDRGFFFFFSWDGSSWLDTPVIDACQRQWWTDHIHTLSNEATFIQHAQYKLCVNADVLVERRYACFSCFASCAQKLPPNFLSQPYSNSSFLQNATTSKRGIPYTVHEVNTPTRSFFFWLRAVDGVDLHTKQEQGQRSPTPPGAHWRQRIWTREDASWVWIPQVGLVTSTTCGETFSRPGSFKIFHKRWKRTSNGCKMWWNATALHNVHVYKTTHTAFTILNSQLKPSYYSFMQLCSSLYESPCQVLQHCFNRLYKKKMIFLPFTKLQNSNAPQTRLLLFPRVSSFPKKNPLLKTEAAKTTAGNRNSADMLRTPLSGIRLISRHGNERNNANKRPVSNTKAKEHEIPIRWLESHLPSWTRTRTTTTKISKSSWLESN